MIEYNIHESNINEMKEIASKLGHIDNIEASAYHFMALLKRDYNDEWYKYEEMVVQAMKIYAEQLSK